MNFVFRIIVFGARHLVLRKPTISEWLAVILSLLPRSFSRYSSTPAAASFRGMRNCSARRFALSSVARCAAWCLDKLESPRFLSLHQAREVQALWTREAYRRARIGERPFLARIDIFLCASRRKQPEGKGLCWIAFAVLLFYSVGSASSISRPSRLVITHLPRIPSARPFAS